MKCMACGGEMGPPGRADVPYRSLPGTMLCGVEVRTCTKCNSKETVIPRQNELDTVLARMVAQRPGHLTGPEVRFLRKAMGWSGRSFAKLIGMAPETVSRWENGHDPISAMADRLLRVLVAQKIAPITDYEAFEQWLDSLGEERASGPHENLHVCRNEADEWTACA